MWHDLETVGLDRDTGGYHRFAWSRTDHDLREWFAGECVSRGLDLTTDRMGNQWAWWGDPDAAVAAGDPGVVIGSHLDSVPDGGAFDGMSADAVFVDHTTTSAKLARELNMVTHLERDQVGEIAPHTVDQWHDLLARTTTRRMKEIDLARRRDVPVDLAGIRCRLTLHGPGLLRTAPLP